MTYFEWAHMNEPLMLSVLTSVDDKQEEKIISMLAENLVYILNNDSECEPD